MKKDNSISSCSKCEHYFVTWDKHFPHGCKLFGFKSGNVPNTTVQQATGAACQNFREKVTPKY
jgi:hypothetical protein